MQSLRSFAAKIGLILASTLSCILLSEIAVRIALPQQLSRYDSAILYESDTTGRGYRLRANVHTTVNTGERAVDFITDESGYRIPARDASAAQAAQGNDSLRIIVLGDSFIQANAVNAEKAIPERLAEFLSARIGATVRAVNAGVEGYSPGQYYLTAREALTGSRYDLGVVAMFIGNDIAASHDTSVAPAHIRTELLFTWPRRFDRDNVIRELLYPAGELLDRSSHLWTLVKSRSKVLLARLDLTGFYFPGVFRLDALESPMWGATVRIFETIATEFDRHDTPVLFVILPASYQVYREDFHEYVAMFDIDANAVDMRLPNGALGAELMKTTLDYVDVLDTLREVSDHAGERTYGSIDSHLSSLGHRVVADAIARRAEAMLSRTGRSQ